MSGAVPRSWWQRAGGAPESVRPGELPTGAEYVIVGGGYAGLATAKHILEARPGAEVVVLEAEFLGYGASGRNGGLVSPLAIPMWLVTADRNADHAWGIRYLNEQARALATDLAASEPAAEATRTSLRLEAVGRITASGLVAVARALDATGIAYTTGPNLRRSGLRLLELEAFTVQPYGLVQALAARARRLGARFVEGAAVAAIEPGAGGKGARVRLRDGRTLSAGTVILATNGYSPSLAQPERIRAKVVYNYMLATEPVGPELAAHIAPGAVFTVELNTAYVFYRLHQGRLVFGGIDKLKHNAPGDLDMPADVRAKLEQHLARSFPGVPLPAIGDSWGGRFHMTATETPIIRRSARHPSIVLNVGYGGTGVALTMICAEIAASLALGRFRDGDAEQLHRLIQATRLPVMGGLRLGVGVVRELIAGARPTQVG